MKRRGPRVAAPDDVVRDVLSRNASYNLGMNATGVIQSELHVEDGEFIVRDVMPGHYVQRCMDEAKRLGETPKQQGGHIAGRVPMPLYMTWRKAWKEGPRNYGLLWEAYLMNKLADSDYKKFATGRT